MARLSFLLLLVLSVVLFSGYVCSEEATENTADLFTTEQREAVAKTEEKHEFQAEVGRLMDILIKYLYSNKEIFLRELISNGSDALDKVRFLALTDKNQLSTGETMELRISSNNKKKTLTIRDTGVGMTKEELIRNLGTVAKSGTTQFVEKMTENAGQDSMSLIGQFGVGFYSVYLVADKVTVASKSNASGKQWIWESSAQGTFTVAEDPRGDTLNRGTEITLLLKPEASEFSEFQTLKKIATKYSEFINFPIYLEEMKETRKDVPYEPEELIELEAKEAAEKAAKKAAAGEDDVTVTEEEEPKKDVNRGPRTHQVTSVDYEWHLINEHKPLWARNPKDVTDEEYKAFYKTFCKDTEEPLTWVHFSAEGDVAFKALLYIPKKAAADMYDKYYGKSSSIKLYVRKVLIAEEFEDFMPRYLSFIRGVVDSDDLPLNVNRETLQKNKLLQVIGKKLVNKAFALINSLVEKDEDEAASSGDASGDSEKYTTFWKQFGKAIRLGIMEDQRNQKKLTALLRFPTSVSAKKLVSLQTYVDRMKSNQEVIYYISGESLAAIQASPFLEKLRRRNLEVLYLAEPLDEYAIQQLPDFEGKKLQSITKEGLSFGKDADAKIKAKLERQQEDYKDLCKYLEVCYTSAKVEKVVVTNRLHDSPAVLVTSQYGYSANMERIMKAQALGDKERTGMLAKRTLEINPRHPIIEEMKNRVASQEDDSKLKDLANLLYDAAALNSGFAVEDAKHFGERIHRVIAGSLNVAGNAQVSEDDDSDESTPVEEESSSSEASSSSSEESNVKDEL